LPNGVILIGTADGFGCGMMATVVAVVSGGMSGLCWFSSTRLAFYLDNRRWPTAEEHAEQ